MGRALAQARADVERLVTTYEKEARNARPADAGGDPGPRDPAGRALRAGRGSDGPRLREDRRHGPAFTYVLQLLYRSFIGIPEEAIRRFLNKHTLPNYTASPAAAAPPVLLAS